MNKKKQETVELFEQKTFLERHAKKFLIAGGIITIAGVTYILKKHGIELAGVNVKLDKAREIGLRSLLREKANAEYEIAEKMEYIKNLDDKLNINVFVRKPEAEKRIAELEKFIREIDIDIKKIEG